MERVSMPPVVPRGPTSTYSIPVSTEWDYLVDEAPVADAYEALRRMGEDCWELVTALSLNQGLLYLIFKRPAADEEQ